MNQSCAVGELKDIERLYTFLIICLNISDSEAGSMVQEWQTALFSALLLPTRQM